MGATVLMGESAPTDTTVWARSAMRPVESLRPAYVRVGDRPPMRGDGTAGAQIWTSAGVDPAWWN